MGRYDKIKVYKNGSFVQPKRIRVWNNGSWLDLGDNDSSNARSLYVYKNGSKKRATLNKTVTSYTGDTYRNGGIQILDGDTCFSPNSSYTNTEFVFTAYVRRKTSGEKNIFKMYGRATPNRDYFYIKLNANGTVSIGVNTQFSSYGESGVTTSAAITDDKWHYIKVRAPLNGSNMYVSIDNGAEVSASSRRAWQVWADNILGDSGLHIRSDGFYLKTANGYGNATSTSNVQANENDSWSKTTWE